MTYGITVSGLTGKPLIGKVSKKGDRFLDKEVLDSNNALNFCVEYLKQHAKNEGSKTIEFVNHKTGKVEIEYTVFE